MRQILRQRELEADPWRYPGEAGVGPRVLAWAELLAMSSEGLAKDPLLGVRLGPTDEVERLAPFVAQLSLIVVHFEQNGDGRGFTQGQMLRQRYHYAAQLRASGAIGRDHLFLLARCGFDAFEFDPAEDPHAALRHLDQFSVAYQSAAGTLVQPRQRPTGGLPQCKQTIRRA